MPIFSNISNAIGRTPLVKLNTLSQGLEATIAVKLESMNPLGSVKDRIAVSMIDEAQKAGLIEPGKSIIIEPTSGNTGIGLAFVCAARGFKLILTMPDTMSQERRKILAHLGAELVLTPGIEGMKGAISKAEELVANYANAYMPQQFENPANPKIHRETTAQEIWQDSEGKVDILVAGVGTGGTITGVGQVLKSKNKDIKIVAVEPKDSAVISQFLENKPLSPSPHKIQGIGAGFIPKILDTTIIDDVVLTSNDDAFNFSRKLAKTEGILAGISSGAAVKAALELARRKENKGKLIVAVLPSTGERYISTALFAPVENSNGNLVSV